MMSLLKNTKVVGGAVVVIALLVLAYFYWGGSAAPATEPVAAPADEPVASQELLMTLGNLRSITLDPSIFSDPLFTSLSDFGVTIPPQAAGRRNPFAPVGSAAH